MSIAKAVSDQFKYWPTRQPNLSKNCKIFHKLNRLLKTSVNFNRVNKEVADLYLQNAYVNKALQQRGIMNMCYYLMLDELLLYDKNSHSYKSKSSKKAIRSRGGTRKLKGGSKSLRKLIAQLLVAFVLLGVSEGSVQDVVTVKSDVQPTMFGKFELDTYTPEGMLQKRKKTADKTMSLILEAQPWILDNQIITIAEAGEVNSQQIEYFEKQIKKINSKLSILSKDASELCSEIVSTAEDKNIFTNDEFYKTVESKFNELKVQNQQKRTADTVKDYGAYAVNAISALAGAVGSAAVGQVSESRNINEDNLLKNAIEEVTQNRDKILMGQLESTAYSLTYQNLCRSSPKPQFLIESEGGTIKMKTYFGNHNTGFLLMSHITTIQKIELLMEKETDKNSSNYIALKSLKERITIQRKLIESSTLFAPLDGIFTGEEALQSILVESTSAADRFEHIVSKINEFLPISEEDAKMEANIRKSIYDQKRVLRSQIANEWKVLVEDASTGAKEVLIEAVVNTANVTTQIIGEASTLAQNITGEIKNVGETVIEGVGELGKKGVGKVGEILEVGIDSILEQWWKIFPALVTFLGLAGASAYGCVLFKSAMTSRRKSPLPPASVIASPVASVPSNIPPPPPSAPVVAPPSAPVAAPPSPLVAAPPSAPVAAPPSAPLVQVAPPSPPSAVAPSSPPALAPSSPPVASPLPTTEQELKNMTIPKLAKLSNKIGINIEKKWKKQDYINAIKLNLNITGGKYSRKKKFVL